MTSNIADISAFESLQSNQNDRTGVSQMGAFQADVFLTNANFKVVDAQKADASKGKIDNWKKQYEAEEKFLADTVRDYETKKKTHDQLEKQFNEVEQAYRKATNDLNEIKLKRTYSHSKLQQGEKLLAGAGIVATTTASIGID